MEWKVMKTNVTYIRDGNRLPGVTTEIVEQVLDEDGPLGNGAFWQDSQQPLVSDTLPTIPVQEYEQAPLRQDLYTYQLGCRRCRTS